MAKGTILELKAEEPEGQKIKREMELIRSWLTKMELGISDQKIGDALRRVRGAEVGDKVALDGVTFSKTRRTPPWLPWKTKVILEIKKTVGNGST